MFKNKIVKTEEMEILEKIFGPLKQTGHLDIEYDNKSDVLWLAFNDTGESAYCTNLNDKLILEKGIYTGGIIGFRILDFKNTFQLFQEREAGKNVG